MRAVCKLAGELGIHLHVGSTAIGLADGKMANRGFLFGPDGKKIYPLRQDPHVRRRSRQWRELAGKFGLYAGGTARLVSLPFGKLGCAICYDVRFPELFRAQAAAGAQIMSVPAAFTRQTGEAHWEILLRARAIENGMFVIAAAQAGVHEDGRETFGHSMIIDPWGRVLASAGGTGEGIVVADIDVSAVAAARGENSEPEERPGVSRWRKCPALPRTWPLDQVHACL